jgi:hypothetical protein
MIVGEPQSFRRRVHSEKINENQKIQGALPNLARSNFLKKKLF